MWRLYKYRLSVTQLQKQLHEMARIQNYPDIKTTEEIINSALETKKVINTIHWLIEEIIILNMKIILIWFIFMVVFCIIFVVSWIISYHGDNKE